MQISYANGLAVTNGLIFNADAINMEDSSSWGFSAYNGKNNDTAGLCMRMFSINQNRIVTNFGYNSCGNKEVWENSDAQHNLAIGYNINLNQDVMFTATYNYEDSVYKIYSNGKIMKEANLLQSYWDNFRKNNIPSIRYFQIGKATWNWITEYFKGKIYSARIYNRALTDNEVLENYEKTVSYHKIENSK